MRLDIMGLSDKAESSQSKEGSDSLSRAKLSKKIQLFENNLYRTPGQTKDTKEKKTYTPIHQFDLYHNHRNKQMYIITQTS